MIYKTTIYKKFYRKEECLCQVLSSEIIFESLLGENPTALQSVLLLTAALPDLLCPQRIFSLSWTAESLDKVNIQQNEMKMSRSRFYLVFLKEKLPEPQFL